MLGAEEIGTETIERARQQVELPRAEARERLRREMASSRGARRSHRLALGSRWAGRLLTGLGRRLLEAGDRLGRGGSDLATPGP